MVLSGMEPATFRIVVRSLNQLRHRVPQIKDALSLNHMQVKYDCNQ